MPSLVKKIDQMGTPFWKFERIFVVVGSVPHEEVAVSREGLSVFLGKWKVVVRSHLHLLNNHLLAVRICHFQNVDNLCTMILDFWKRYLNLKICFNIKKLDRKQNISNWTFPLSGMRYLKFPRKRICFEYCYEIWITLALLMWAVSSNDYLSLIFNDGWREGIQFGTWKNGNMKIILENLFTPCSFSHPEFFIIF